MPNLGQPKVPHLALGDQITNGRRYFLDRYARIHSVPIEKIDFIGRRRLSVPHDGFSNTTGAAFCSHSLAILVFKAEFCREYNLVALARQSFAHLTEAQSVGIARAAKGDVTPAGERF